MATGRLNTDYWGSDEYAAPAPGASASASVSASSAKPDYWGSNVYAAPAPGSLASASASSATPDYWGSNVYAAPASGASASASSTPDRWGAEEDAVASATPNFDPQDFFNRGGWTKYNSEEEYLKELEEEQREKEIKEAEEALRIEEFNSSPAAMTSNELVIDNGQITENTPSASASATKTIELNEEQKDLVRVRDAVIRQMFVNSELIRELDGTSNCEISFRNNDGRYALFLRPRDTNYMINATCGFGGEPVKDRIYFNLSKKQEGNYKIPTEFMSEYVVVDAATLIK